MSYCWNERKSYIIYLFLASIIDGLTPLISVILPKLIIDEFLGDSSLQRVMMYVVVATVGVFVANTLSHYLHTEAFLVKGLIFNEFDIMLGRKLANADFQYLEDPKFLDVKEKAYKFLYYDGRGFAGVIDNTFAIFGKCVSFASIVFIIATLNIYVVVVFVLLVLVNSYFDAKYKKKNVEIDLAKTPFERKGYYLSQLLNDFSYGKEMRIGKMQDFILTKYKRQIGQTHEFYKKAMMNSRKSMAIGACTVLLQQIVSYGYLTYQVIRDSISVGDFMMYFNAINLFNSSMKDVMDNVVEIYRFSEYYESVEKYMNVPSTIMNSNENQIKEFSPNEMKIEFKDVSFKYPGQEGYAIKNFSHTFDINERTAIVGENGAGKTTIVKLITRLYDPTDGVITVNGVDIKDIDYNSYIQNFSAVFQDYKLFAFSIAENIALSETQSKERIDDILEEVDLKEKVDSLPKKELTQIYKLFDENGLEPSGGQGQRIAIARALYRDAKFIILDEPTAAVDPIYEARLMQQFNSLVDEKSALFITHRLSSVKFCNNIIVLENGEKKETGTHNELMQNNSLYSKMYNLQADSYKI